MKIRFPPKRCLAIIVGIETYAEKDWLLPGAVRDALQFACWLLDREVPPENVRLFTTHSADADADFLKMRSRLEEEKVAFDVPGHSFLREFLTGTAAERPWKDFHEDGALLLYWSGHGFTDERDYSPLLYTADASEKSPYGVNLGEWLRRLKSDPVFRLFSQQWIVLDACRQWASSTSSRPETLSVDLSKSHGDPHSHQYVLFATPPGGYARTRDEKSKSSPFSAALLKLLAKNAWADLDLDQLCAALTDHFKDDAQAPDAWRWTPSGLTRDRFVHCTDRAGKLGVILEGLGIPIDWLERVYRQIDPGKLTRNEPMHVSDMVARLARHVGGRDANGLDLLAQFAVRLELCCERSSEPKAVEAGTAIGAWLEKNLEAPVLIAERARLRSSPPKVLNVQVDVPGPTDPDVICARWEIPPGPGREWTGSPKAQIATGLEKAWDDVSEDAVGLSKAGHVVEITLELRVPEEQLCQGINHLEINSLIKLSRDKLATLRLRGRGKKPSLLLEWRNAWNRMRESIERQEIFKVHWLSNPREAGEYSPRFKEAQWVGCTFFPGNAGGGLPESLRRPLARGAPLVLWPTSDPPDVDKFKTDVEAFLKKTTLQLDDFAAAVTGYHREPGVVALSLLLDIPDFGKPETVPLVHPLQKPG